MANLFSYQILKDDVQHAIIKITGQFTGSDGQESNLVRIQANTLYGALGTDAKPLRYPGAANTALPYYGLQLFRCWYDVSGSGNVQMVWTADTPQTLMYMTGGSEYDGAGNWVTIPNNSQGTANSNGNIGIITHGMSANDGYTIIAEFRKDNAYYQRGQFDDPGAFNYGIYAIKP